MQVLQLNDPGVKAVLQKDALQGRSRVGRGKFSVVLDGSRPDTVFHVTCDPLSYALHCDGVAACSGPHFSRVVDDWGGLEENRTGDTIYVFETERLDPLRGNLHARRQARAVMKAIDWSRFDGGWTDKPYRIIERAIKAYDTFGLDKSIVEALDDLLTFTSNFPEACLDLHSANFMVRPETGELILNDPVCDFAMYDAAWRRLSEPRFNRENLFK